MPSSNLPATVLVVEDDPALLKLATVLLENAGHAVRPFNEPEAALAWVRNNPDGAIDVAVVDMMLPRMNGAEFCRRLARVRPSVSRVLMSGYGPDDLDALDEGVLFLEKPFTDQSLTARVSEALQS